MYWVVLFSVLGRLFSAAKRIPQSYFLERVIYQEDASECFSIIHAAQNVIADLHFHKGNHMSWRQIAAH